MKREMDEYVEVVRKEIWGNGSTRSAVEKLIQIICKDEGLDPPKTKMEEGKK